MAARNRNPALYLAGKNVPPLIEFFYEINHLKRLFRRGWLRSIPAEQCESVAEHTFGVALLAWALAERFFPQLNPEKILKLALIHDIGEIHAGDITPYDGISAAEKNQAEYRAVKQLFSRLPGGEKYLALWEEYENGTSPEAQFVKQIDRLEMALQASIYEHQEGINLEEFFGSAAAVIRSPELKAVFADILRSRKEPRASAR